MRGAIIAGVMDRGSAVCKTRCCGTGQKFHSFRCFALQRPHVEYHDVDLRFLVVAEEIGDLHA